MGGIGRGAIADDEAAIVLNGCIVIGEYSIPVQLNLAGLDVEAIGDGKGGGAAHGQAAAALNGRRGTGEFGRPAHGNSAAGDIECVAAGDLGTAAGRDGAVGCGEGCGRDLRRRAHGDSAVRNRQGIAGLKGIAAIHPDGTIIFNGGSSGDFDRGTSMKVKGASVRGHVVIDLEGGAAGKGKRRARSVKIVEGGVGSDAETAVCRGGGVVLRGKRKVNGNAVIVETGVIKAGRFIDQDSIVVECCKMIGKADRVIDTHRAAVEGTAITSAVVKGEGFAGGDVKCTAGTTAAADGGVKRGV